MTIATSDGKTYEDELAWHMGIADSVQDEPNTDGTKRNTSEDLHYWEQAKPLMHELYNQNIRIKQMYDELDAYAKEQGIKVPTKDTVPELTPEQHEQLTGSKGLLRVAGDVVPIPISPGPQAGPAGSANAFDSRINSAPKGGAEVKTLPLNLYNDWAARMRERSRGGKTSDISPDFQAGYQYAMMDDKEKKALGRPQGPELDIPGGAGNIAPKTAKHYEIYDILEKKVVGGPYKNELSQRRRARTRADTLNLEYGAHRYTARPIYED